MAAKPTIVTQERFDELKSKHKHHWVFLGEQTNEKNKKLLCRCELCERELYVMWRWLYEGKSTRCRGCARRLTEEQVLKFNSELRSKNRTWILTGECQTGLNGSRRFYQIRCRFCGDEEFLPWMVVRGQKKMTCGTCESRKRVPQSLEGEIRDLKVRWNRLMSQPNAHASVIEFENFEQFAQWSLTAGFKIGYRLLRRNKFGPYSRMNCYWTNNFENKAFPEIALTLPLGAQG